MREPKTFFCSCCDQKHPIDQCIHFEGQTLCPSCYDSHTLICRDCGERIWRGDNAGTGDHPLCQSCYDLDYTSCVRCGALLRLSSACYAQDDVFLLTCKVVLASF